MAGDLSTHFSRREFLCHCGCGFGGRDGDVSIKLVICLEKLRAHFGKPVTIVSGCRCRNHNRHVGGASASQHCYGTAADLRVEGVSPRAVADYLVQQYPNKFGIGRYLTWTHFDVRSGKARWGSV